MTHNMSSSADQPKSAPLDKITFFERFEADILSGRKTITLRNEAESHVPLGQVIPVYTLETGRWFCNIEILARTAVAFDALDDSHAEQENMPLAELQALIQCIYPGIDALYEIQFKLSPPKV